MSDLGLNLNLPAPRGRRSQGQRAAKKRDLTVADVQAMWDLPEGGLSSEASPLLKIRNTHHMLARLLAQGIKQVEISLATGYSPSYISSIQNDPAFKNLVAFYQSQEQEIFVSVHERLAALSMVASEELLERAAIDPDSFTNREMIEVLTMAADRTGAGPQSRNVNVNVNVDMGKRLSAARERAFSSGSLAPPLKPELEGPESSIPEFPSEILELRPTEYKESK